MSGLGETVAIALSGGVDSSVAAARLLAEGRRVIALTLQLLPCEQATESRSCCGVDGVVQARAAAGRLGIPHYVLECHREFEELVLRRSWLEYARGRTPNPCVWCNNLVKFGLLREMARRLGANHLATGHYARLGTGGELRRGADSRKDQSYFLFGLDAAQRAATLFPLGEYTKDRVRVEARELGLPNAERADSQDACLVGREESFAEMLRRRFDAAPSAGTIVDDANRILGRHEGIHHFTIGQRHGLGIATGQRAWVRAIESDTGTVRVTAESTALEAGGLLAGDVVWHRPFDSIAARPCLVQTRYRQKPLPAMVEPLPHGAASVRFESPARAVTPGQAVVFYDGDTVLGGGWIEKALP